MWVPIMDLLWVGGVGTVFVSPLPQPLNSSDISSLAGVGDPKTCKLGRGFFPKPCVQVIHKHPHLQASRLPCMRIAFI